jgi:hypothetical protein
VGIIPTTSELKCIEDINQKVYARKLSVKHEVIGAFDENWYNEFKHLYRKKPNIKPYVKRLVLSHGVCNLRPVFPRSQEDHREECSNISETYLRPPDHMTEKNRYYLKSLKKHDAYGTEVNCVPYITPNPYFGVCAQAALWICFKILERASGGSVSAYSIPEIQISATGHPFSDSKGLSLSHMNRIFQTNSCQSFIYNNIGMGLNDEEMFNIVYAYVESGLPVIIGVDVSKLSWWHNSQGYHAIILIGHTIDKRTGKIDGFLVHDESAYPYLEIKREELLNAWDITEDDKKLLPEQLREAKHRLAVIGTPPNVMVGYESALQQLPFLNILYQRGMIKTRDFALWPKLVSRSEVELLFNVFTNFKEPKFRKFALERLDKAKLSRYMWMLRLIKHEETRTRKPVEFDGLLLIDATDKGNLLFLLVENECVVYLSEKKNRIISDKYT